MKWEELKVYHPLTKEELKPAFKDFTKIIADNLKPFGFSLMGRKLIARSNDLLQVIHIDTRGSWTGVSESFETEIALVAISDPSPFVRGLELTGIKRIEDIVTGIRNYHRITQEYALLADFLTRKIIEVVLPYFDKNDSSVKVLKNRNSFKLGNAVGKNEDLLIFCELQNRINIEALKIVDKTLSLYPPSNFGPSKFREYLDELAFYKQAISTNNWAVIEQKLQTNEKEVRFFLLSI